GAAEQLVVTGITAQRGAVIGRRRRGIALTTRVPSGEIAARRRDPGKAIARLRLRGEHSRPSYSERSQCGHSRTPQGWRRDHGPPAPPGGRTPTARPGWAEWTVWPRPAITAPIGHVHRL